MSKNFQESKVEIKKDLDIQKDSMKDRLAKRKLAKTAATTVKNDDNKKFNFNFTEQTPGIGDDNDISAIMQTTPVLDTSATEDASFDLKWLSKMQPSLLTQIEEEASHKSEQDMTGHMSTHQQQEENSASNKVFDDDFALEIDTSNGYEE